MQLPDHILFVLLGVILPAVLLVSGYRRRKVGPRYWSGEMKVRLYYSNGILLYALAALVLLVSWWGDRPLTEVGLGWGRIPYDLTAVLLIAGFLLLYLIDLYRESESKERRVETRQTFSSLGFMPATASQFLHFLFLAIAAGVGEEIVYRGFMINYLAEMLGTEGLAATGVLLLPAISFGLGHAYQGWKAVIKIIAMAVLFGFFFLRTNTLWPLMLLHAAIDIMGGLMSWYLLGKEK